MWKIEDMKVDKQGLCTFTKEKQKKSRRKADCG